MELLIPTLALPLDDLTFFLKYTVYNNIPINCRGIL